MRILIRLVAVALVGGAVAVLVSCGGSGKGLIPAASAGPLQSDFEAVARAATSGHGSCANTESALGKTEQDFLSLPASVDNGLHARLEEGISNLRKRALDMCIQPAPSATTSTPTVTTTTPTSTETTPPTSTTPETPTTQSTPTTTTPPSEGGGTEAPGEGEGESEEGKGKGKGKGKGEVESEGSGGASAGGASAGDGQ